MFFRSTNGTIHSWCLCAAIAMASGAATAGPVQWKNASGPTLQNARLSPRSPVDALRVSVLEIDASGHGGYLLIRLKEPPNKAARLAMRAEGLELLSPVGSNTFFARISPDADAEALGGHLVEVGNISRAHKLHPLIEEGNMPPWAIVGSQRVIATDGIAESTMVAAYVMMHRDVNVATPEMDELIGSYGGAIQSTMMSMNAMVVEMPFWQVKELANDERVQWIEPPLPPMESNNASNRVLTQVNAAQAAPYSLDGTGVTVFVYDGGSVRASHSDFSGRVTNIDSAAVNYHATHVAGTIGGDGSTDLNNRGMAPGVNILAAGFEVSGGLSAGFLYTDPGDLEADYSLALSLGASITNNSIGSNIAQNGYPCVWQGDYGITSGLIDNIIRGSLGDQVSVFWAAGNERGNGRCGTGYGTTAPPGNSKNAITVGAINSNDDSMTDFSSWGPSDDGRIRPVLSGPGCQTGSDGGVTSTGDGFDTQYITLCGTSMASPTAAGIGALILQDFRIQFPSLGDMSNQLMKAILIEGAVDILNAGPDYQSGYGSIRAVDSIDFLRTGNFKEEAVDQGSSSTFTIQVNPGDSVFRVTIVWDDPAGAPNVSPALVNDLDLIVIDPTGTRHYPWTLNPESPSAPAVRTQEDHLNNIEQVLVENPIAGVWQVQVVGSSVPEGPQSFAMTSALDLGDGLLSVSVTQAAPEYVLPGTAVQVEATISEGVDAIVPGSIELNYRYDAGGYSILSMVDDGAGVFSATIPGADCGQFIEFYVSAGGSMAGTVFSPPTGPSGPMRIDIGEIRVVMTDSFETENGWTVLSDTTDGQWTRGVPVDCSSRGAPGSDSDGSGMCWITDNDAGDSCNSDVDNGTTTLISPILSMPDGGEFSFDYWYSDIPTGEVNGDQWAVDGSTDGGVSWMRLRTSTSVSSSWRTDTILVGQEIDASSTMRFRFIINDIGTQNVIEGGIDNIRITQFVCEEVVACVPDYSGDGVLNFLDVSAFLGLFGSGDPDADLNGDGQFNFIDVSSFLVLYGAGCP